MQNGECRLSGQNPSAGWATYDKLKTLYYCVMGYETHLGFFAISLMRALI